MRCIACGTDNKLKVRIKNNCRCSNCGHLFVFEPTMMTAPIRFTDSFFAKAIADLSAENTLYFTPRQLYYLIERRLKRKAFTSSAIIQAAVFIALITLTTFVMSSTASVMPGILNQIIIPNMVLTLLFCFWNFMSFNNPRTSNRNRRAGATALQLIGGINLILVNGVNLQFFRQFISPVASNIWLVGSTILGVIAILLGTYQKSRLRSMTTLEEHLVKRTQFNDWLARWERVNGTPPTLLKTANNNQLPAQINPEVSAYSFDRVLVTSSDAIAQMLIANNLHLEYNCAILSATGYPQAIFNTVMEMLRRNANLTVYALHGADPSGVRMLYDLKTRPQWFRDQQVQFVDLGISPRQILDQSNIVFYRSEAFARAAKNLPQVVRESLSARELQWLDAGNYVELEAFGPQKLLQVIRMGMSTSLASDTSDGSLWLADDSSAYMLTSFG
jgi:hypothetical protein